MNGKQMNENTRKSNTPIIRTGMKAICNNISFSFFLCLENHMNGMKGIIKMFRGTGKATKLE